MLSAILWPVLPDADKLARLLNQIHTGLDKVVAIDVSTEEVGVVRG